VLFSSLSFLKKFEARGSFNSFLRLKISRLSVGGGKRKHSMKLAAPEFSRNRIDPRSDDEVTGFSGPDFETGRKGKG
jgi:hypothetical protein